MAKEQNKNYYFTFMNKQSFKKKYVRINAANEGEAREAMFAHFGDKWMTSYTEDKFEGQAERWGLTELCWILCVNHGTSEHPSMEYI